jgi:predicted nucleotidyltransferase component of viral defense system
MSSNALSGVLIVAKRRITEGERNQWAATAQTHVLAALLEATHWQPNTLAFHGGTSLHLSWQSPRFSEDLDFLVSKSAAPELVYLMDKVQKRVREQLLVIDPGFDFAIRNKTSKLDRMGNFQAVVTHKDVHERAMVKAEFWRVDDGYLEKYPVEYRKPVPGPGAIAVHTNALVPAGTLMSSIADKLTALAGRPYLKWRDIFDVWWVTSQPRIAGAPTSGGLPDGALEQYLHNRTAYANTSLSEDAVTFGRFLAIADSDLILAAQKDLRPFLPAPYWEALGPHGVQHMIDRTKSVVTSLVEKIQELEDCEVQPPTSSLRLA